MVEKDFWKVEVVMWLEYHDFIEIATKIRREEELEEEDFKCLINNTSIVGDVENAQIAKVFTDLAKHSKNTPRKVVEIIEEYKEEFEKVYIELSDEEILAGVLSESPYYIAAAYLGYIVTGNQFLSTLTTAYFAVKIKNPYAEQLINLVKEKFEQ